MNVRSMRKRLISAMLVLVMMVSTLLGTTYAWFTDSVKSEGNKIESGTLKIDLLHSVDGVWTSLRDEPNHKIFNYDNWEPGYTRVESLKIANVGSLALKYKLSMAIADGTAILGENGENLADVIDVYVIYGASTAQSFNDIKATWTYKGTLFDVMNNPADFVGGNLTPSESEQLLTVALHMSEEAGNEYQNLSVGDIYVNLIATQLGAESDSFGNDYDADVIFPITVGKLYSASAPVTADENGNAASDVKLGNDGDTGSATIPTGAKLVTGATTLTLDITAVAERAAVVEMKGGDVAFPLDVHVDGLASDNTVPVIITINGILPKNFASYNVRLFHVENDVTTQMTIVNNISDVDAHNEYYYDPESGSVTLAMATFSEVTAAVEANNAWDGKTVDYSWYNTTGNEFHLETAAQFVGFAHIVGGMAPDIAMDEFIGKTVYLDADINLGGSNGVIFYPVGYQNNKGTFDRTGYSGDNTVVSNVYSFEGIFDGNGHTISDIYQNTWEMFGDYNDGYSGTPNYYKDGMGLFGFVYNGTVVDLVVDNFRSDGEFCTTGVVAAYTAGQSTFENITILNSNPRAYNVPNGGVVGYAYEHTGVENVINFTNINVDSSNKITALWGSWDVGCGGILGRVNGATTIDMKNCTVGAVIDVYNDVCANYQYYQYRYSGMLIGTVGGDSNPLTGNEKLKFSNVTVYIGDWADYYYCEFTANSEASYSPDYQFSRVDRDDIVFDANNMPIGCTHTHSEEEDKLYHYLPFNQLYTGYGWGSSPQSTADGVTVINYFYMITYYDDHGDVLRVEYVTDGQSDDTHNIANEKNITYTPATSDAEFLGWVNKGASSVTSIPIGNRNDIELFATYAGSFYARFYDENGNVIQSVEIKKADDARSLVNVAGPASSSEYLAFDHWEVREVDKNGVVTTTDLATYIDSLVKNNDNFKGSHSDVAIYPYYAINTGLGLTPVDTDGDGVVNYYTVEAVNGSNFGTVLTIPGEVNGVPVKIITDLTSTWADNVEHIIVKDGVEEIGEGAFQQTKNLQQLELPTSIIKIGKNAFTAKWGHEGKDKDLVIIYNGTKEQWDAIEKESGWSYNLPEDTIIQCLDGYYQKGKKNSDNWTWNPTNN